MTSPVFLTVPGPEDNDVADGLKAFNNIADITEQNLDILNKSAAQISGLFSGMPTTTAGASLFTPAAGWAYTGDYAARTFARTWQGMVYIYLLFSRTGAAIVASSHGNVGDQDLGYMSTAYRPPTRSFGSCIINGNFTAQCNMNTNGTLRLQGLSYGATIPTGAYLIYQAAWPLPA